jgi:hypothetical protein
MEEMEEKPNVELPDEDETGTKEEVTEDGETTDQADQSEQKTDDIAGQNQEPESAPEEEDEPTKVQKRIDELTWRSKTAIEKLDLLKNDPEGYYQRYPEERPVRQQTPQQPDDVDEYETMIIKGGKYDGMTLGELAQTKPLAAQHILNNYLEDQRQQARADEEKTNLSKKAWENDVNTFGQSLCQEIYGKQANDLSPEQIQKVNDTIFEVSQWKKENRKDNYSFHDAWLLMNKDKFLKSAKEKTAEKVVQSLKKNPVGSVSGKAESSKTSINYEEMDESALGDHISGMSDKEAREFYRTAPESLKNKYPSWPWD